MAEVIIMPKLGFNMDEGQLVKWCKNVGDDVGKGEVLFEINTDKTTMPVEAISDGVLLKTMLNEGEFAAVFTPIAVIGQAGEDADAAIAASAAPVPASDLKLTPKAKKLIQDEGIDTASLAAVTGTGFEGGITAKDIQASPLAKKIAERDGVDLAAVQSSRIGGKVMKANVLNAGPASCAQAAWQGAGQDTRKVLSKAPYKGIRKVIGERLAQSMDESPHAYFQAAVDTTALTAFPCADQRRGRGQSGGVRPSCSGCGPCAQSVPRGERLPCE
jgi:pyruvate dehydrogenase E2 component (dihydrolipoamide acetyltransferase)